VILLASSSSETLASWEHALHGFDVIVSVRQIAGLKECLKRTTPQVLLLGVDLPGLDGPKGVADLRKASPLTKIIALTRFSSDEAELALFRAGVHGCCRSDVDSQLLRRAVVAVQQGELWIRRCITPQLLNDLAARLRDEVRATDYLDERLADLTSREREIAELIGNGESNKKIARQLFITERTVKAHVSGIFRKLGVGDRLSIALRVSARRETDGEHVN
jgi:DNA-binding NarL/FixJ family response regulator